LPEVGEILPAGWVPDRVPGHPLRAAQAGPSTNRAW